MPVDRKRGNLSSIETRTVDAPERARMPRRSFLGATALALLPSSVARAKEPLDRWLAEIAKSPGVEARFHEEKRLRLLKTPLESSGKLYFSSEGLLAKRTLAPRPALVLLRGDELLLGDARGTKTFDLRADPRLGTLVRSLANVLRGDRPALERHYRLSFEAGERTRLGLVPREETLAKIVARMDLVFVATKVESLEVLETNGDRTVTHFAEVDASRRFTVEEKKKVFGPQL